MRAGFNAMSSIYRLYLSNYVMALLVQGLIIDYFEQECYDAETEGRVLSV